MLSSGRPWKCCIFVAAKTDQIHSKKKQAQKLIALIIYSVARGIPQPDVQIVNFEFIMWALGGDAIRVA